TKCPEAPARLGHNIVSQLNLYDAGRNLVYRYVKINILRFTRRTAMQITQFASHHVSLPVKK
ncbi:unnamed protein product, partial [Oikopleura dioica]